MKITLLGQEVEFIDAPNHEVEVECGIFIASVHQYPATPSMYSHDWVLEARTLHHHRHRYGEGKGCSLEEAVANVNALARQLSREMVGLSGLLE